jgi:hypothetical protein
MKCGSATVQRFLEVAHLIYEAGLIADGTYD